MEKDNKRKIRSILAGMLTASVFAAFVGVVGFSDVSKAKSTLTAQAQTSIFKNRYTLGTGVTMNTLDLGIDFTFDRDGASVRYNNALSVMDGLDLDFLVKKTTNAYSEIRFTFTDSVDSSIKQTVSVYKNATETATASPIKINDGEQAYIGSSFYGNTSSHFLFTLAKDGSLSNQSGLSVKNADANFSFPSGFVYMDISIYGKTAGTATLQIYKIGNHYMSNVSADYEAPLVHVISEPEMQAEQGAEIDISKAYASDVYDSNVKIRVSVTLGEETVYSHTSEDNAFVGAKFTATKYGDYEVVYEAEDSTGNINGRIYYIRVRDKIAPTLEVKGDMIKTVKVGKTLTFPEVVASDNAEENPVVYVSIIDPMNWYHVIKLGEEFKVEMVGRYIVQFYCEDSATNQTFSQTYRVEAEK